MKKIPVKYMDGRIKEDAANETMKNNVSFVIK